MKKWILRIIYAALALAPVAALADYTATQGAGSTVFAFVCSSTKICPAMVLIDSTNTEKATAGNPLRIDPVGTTTQPVSAASLPLPTGAATSANQPTNAAQASTTSGQTGTMVQGAVTTAAPTYTTAQTNPLSLNTAGGLRVDGSGVTQPVSAASLPLPTGAATSANQTNASQKTQIVDGSGNVIASTSNNLNVQCANCSGSGASAADAASFTAGTSTFAPAGGEFTSGGATACVTGHQCLVGITPARAFLTDLSSQAGTAITSAPSAYGTAPSGNVIGVNAFVTNATPLGQATMANSSPVVIASNQSNLPANITQVGGSALALGQTTMSASVPVTLASNQSAGDPCSIFALKSYAPISLTASGQVITGTASKKTYICSINLISATAQNIAVVEGTGSTCATNIFGLAGGTTAATGWNLGANGGLAWGSGTGTLVFGSGDANATAANVCLLLSSTGQTSGGISYVQQ